MARKAPEVRVVWSKREADHIVHYDKKTTGHLVYHALFNQKLFGDEESFAKQLDERGYDLKTLKFSIRKKDV